MRRRYVAHPECRIALITRAQLVEWCPGLAKAQMNQGVRSTTKGCGGQPRHESTKACGAQPRVVDANQSENKTGGRRYSGRVGRGKTTQASNATTPTCASKQYGLRGACSFVKRGVRTSLGARLRASTFGSNRHVYTPTNAYAP